MSNKTVHEVNGGFAIYYGIGCSITAIGGVVATGVWLYEVFTGQSIFSWWTLIGYISFTLAIGLIGYSLLRVGYEEIEK